MTSLPERTIGIRNIMNHAELPGAVLNQLPDLLASLQQDKKTRKYYLDLEASFNKRDINAFKDLEKSVDWINDKTLLIKSSKFASYSVVKNAIESLDRALDFSSYCPPTSYLSHVLLPFKQAVDAIASFGADPLFSGWAEIHETLIHPGDELPNISNNQEGRVKIKNIKALVNKIGHGAVCWMVNPPREEKKAESKEEGKKKKPMIFGQTIALVQGYLKQLIFPEYLDRALRSMSYENQQDWTEKRDSDPVTLFGYLYVLAQYKTYAPLKLYPELRITSLHEAESLCVQGHVGYYLSKFSSEDKKKHPHTTLEILKYIDTFLDMFKIGCKNFQQPRPDLQQPKRKINDSRVNDKKLAVEWMKKEWVNTGTSKDLIVGRLMTEISNNVLKLSKDYKRSTYDAWAKEADPLPINEKLKRKKSKNIAR